MPRTLVISSAVAAVVAALYLVVGTISAGDPQQRIQLELADDGTTWPWHSSLQRASAAWINSPAGRAAGNGAEVVATAPENIVELEILVSAASAPEAEAAADAVASAFLAHDIGLQRDPFETELDQLTQIVAELDQEFSEQELAVGQASNDVEIAARSTVFEGTAALKSQYEGQLAEADRRLSELSARYSIVSSGPVSPVRDRAPEALKIFGGLVLLVSIGLTFRTGPAAD